MSNNHVPAPRSVSFDPAAMAIIITDLLVADPAVVNESRRWSTGERGAVVDFVDLAGADLGGFVTQALSVGAQAIALAGGAQDTFELERLVNEVGAKTAESTAQAAAETGRVVKAAADAVTKATEDARREIADTEAATRKTYAETVTATTAMLRGDVERVFGGENPELLTKLTPMLEAVGRKMGEQAFKQTGELLDKVSRQFDPADPTSPFAKQAKTLAEQQHALTESLNKNHLALVNKVGELATAVEVSKAARTAAEEAAARTAKVTPLKGTAYEASIGRVMDGIAAGLGDEYAETGTLIGALVNCKKGDGVLAIDGGAARVVIEMHDSAVKRGWNDYLDEAERNREAAASIGLVPTAAQNGGQTVRVLSSRRLVLAFDPNEDDLDLLRTVVQLMRASAIAAASRQDVEGLATAEENILSALSLLEKINTIRSASGSIRRGADKIDKECNTVQTGVKRLLGQALDALSGVALVAVEVGDSASTESIRATGAIGAA